MKRVKVLCAFMLVGLFSMAQTETTAGNGVSKSGTLDGFYHREHIPTKKVISYTPIREADVIWSRRVWRTIPLQEKFNYPLYYPETPQTDRLALWDIIKKAVLNCDIHVYDLKGAELDDKFNYKVEPPSGNCKDKTYQATLNSYMGKVVETPIYDEFNEPTGEFDSTVQEYLTSDIVSYKIKEDWFFDKQRSVLDVRIIGLAPVVKQYNEAGEYVGEKLLFWLHFDECRYVFQNYYVYNRQNDADRMSFDDLFWKRMFHSYIHKETNVYDRSIIDYERNGVKQLLESERITKEIFNLEQDMWSY